MTNNNIKDFIYSNRIDFTKLPAFHASIDSLFDGPKNYSTIVSEVMTGVKHRAGEAVYQKAVLDIDKLTKQKVENYIHTISYIVGLVYAITKKDLAKNIVIMESRTKFCFDSEWIDINFVIDADQESEITFSAILSYIQHSMLDKRNIVVELFYVNKKNKEIDYAALKNDYAFIVKPIEVKI